MKNDFLPSFYLKNTADLTCDFYGADHPENLNFNQNYPYVVHYKFNSRGYRDYEWPGVAEQCKSAVWCIGDSATLGIGSPVAHTWPQLLADRWQKPTINISLMGASNDFIERKCVELLTELQPEFIVLCWSFLYRRDYLTDQVSEFVRLETQRNWQEFYLNIKDTTWPPCQDIEDMHTLPAQIQQEIQQKYQAPTVPVTDETYMYAENHDQVVAQAARRGEQQEVEYFLDKIHNISAHQQTTRIFHTIVPNAASAAESKLLKQKLQEIDLPMYFIEQCDHARDKSHWDIKTNTLIVDKVSQQLLESERKKQ